MRKKKNKVIIRRSKDIQLIRRLHDETFPDDEFYGTVDAVWWVGYCGDAPVCFAGVDPDHRLGEGFLCRAGVLNKYRGQGLQKRMIKARERYLVSEGIRRVWTYINPSNAASLNSLYRLGYKAYLPAHEECRVEGFVHMVKSL